MDAFHRKLMKYWIQSFLLGVPKIVVGFRTRDGKLVDIQEIETQKIPETVNAKPNPQWNADMCVNFAGVFLDCTCSVILTSPRRGHGLRNCTKNWLTDVTGLKGVITDEGVWRIRRNGQSPVIEVFKVEETGHGDIISDEFKNWRIKLNIGPDPTADEVNNT